MIEYMIEYIIDVVLPIIASVIWAGVAVVWLALYPRKGI